MDKGKGAGYFWTEVVFSRALTQLGADDVLLSIHGSYRYKTR